jgi:hypothetical protein
MKPPLKICLSLFRYLANAYPHEFRMLHGEDLDRMGEDAIPEAWRRYGLFGLLRLLADIAVRLPVEYLTEIRQDVIYALRVLAQSPGFAAVGVLSTAVGIGMCSVILCGSNAMLGPLPGARDPAELVHREDKFPTPISSIIATSSRLRLRRRPSSARSHSLWRPPTTRTPDGSASLGTSFHRSIFRPWE